MNRVVEATAAIIGAGLVGAAAALELSRRGVSAILIDRSSAGAAASGVNYGGVRRQGRPVEQLRLAQRAYEIWADLKTHIGIDGEYTESGHLKLATTERDLAKLVAYRDCVEEHGLDLEILDEPVLRLRFPWISGAIGGSFCRTDGHANPRLVAPAYARAAARAGAQLLEHFPIDRIEMRGDRFVLTSATDIEIRSEYLLNCAGAWGGTISQMFDEPTPMRSIFPNMLVTEPLAPFMDVSVGMEGGGVYGRQVSRGNCVLGGGRGFGLDADRARPAEDATLALMKAAGDLFPALRQANVIRTWSGVEGALPNGNPIIGASGTTRNLFHAFGFGGAGFQLAPGVGAVLADLVVDGHTATPIDAFSIGQWSGGIARISDDVGSNES